MGIKINNVADVTEVNGVADIAEINGVVVPAGGIALVQSAGNTTADGSSGLTVSFGVPCTAGNSVLAAFSNAVIGNPAPTLVGGGGGSMGSAAAEIEASTTAAYIFAVHNVASGVTGVTGTIGAEDRLNNIIAEFSGLANAVAEGTATNSAVSDTLAIGTVTPTSANNLLVAIFAFDADVTVVTPPAGWTLLDARQGGASVWEYVYYKIQTSADASNPTIVLSGSADIAGAAAAFGGS